MAKPNFNIPGRPCLVTQISRSGAITEPKKALFYGLFTEAWVVEPSLLKGGHPGGTMQTTVAVVEFEDGTIRQVPMDRIRLLDSAEKFSGYDWAVQEEE